MQVTRLPATLATLSSNLGSMTVQSVLRVVLVMVLALLPSAALAQNFSGTWSGKGPAVVSGCQIELNGDGRATSTGCLGDLSFLTQWKSKGVGVQLYSISGGEIARMSGTSFFLMGATAGGQRLFLTRGERCSVAAWGTDICLDQSEWVAPPGNAGMVKTLAGVNIRSTWDIKSQKVGKVPASTCFEVFNCQHSQGGALWCQARYDGIEGWVTKFTINDDQVNATFVNRCE